MADNTSKAAIRQNFVDQIDQLVDVQNAKYMAGLNQAAGNFYQPALGAWDGDLHNIVGMGIPFDRTSQAEDFQNAAANGGVTGDYEITQLQGDMLAVMERAYRARHHSSVRTRCHAAARHRGHGHPTGVLRLGILGYLQLLEKQSKEARS